jgi:Uncharacterized conserved protein
LARETLKDPYVFDFLSVGDEAHERELETALVERITRFLLELGKGFAFVGRQFHLEVGGEDFTSTCSTIFDFIATSPSNSRPDRSSRNTPASSIFISPPWTNK